MLLPTLWMFSEETKGLDVYTATFTVVRSQGLYTEVSVRWNIVGKENNTDLRPLSGLLVFPSGEKNAFIILQSIADEVNNEIFPWNLSTLLPVCKTFTGTSENSWERSKGSMFWHSEIHLLLFYLILFSSFIPLVPRRGWNVWDESDWPVRWHKNLISQHGQNHNHCQW